MVATYRWPQSLPATLKKGQQEGQIPLMSLSPPDLPLPEPKSKPHDRESPRDEHASIPTLKVAPKVQTRTEKSREHMGWINRE